MLGLCYIEELYRFSMSSYDTFNDIELGLNFRILDIDNN